jgi:two-component system nitrate/nitrite response regulator NarL
MLNKSGTVIRIVIIDDHDIFIAALRAFLEKDPELIVIGEGHNTDEAIRAASEKPDLILLDLLLGPESGLDILPELIKAADGARVLVLTGVPDPEVHVRAVCLGAMGIINKIDPPHLLLKAIHKVHAGELWLNRTMTATAMTQLQAANNRVDPEAAKIATLTARELEVVSALGEGLRNKDIAERLCLSEKTVRHYLTSIFDKLDVADRLELIIHAYRHGLAKVPARQHSPVAK